ADPGADGHEPESASRVEDRLREEAATLVALVRLLVAEREPDVALAAAVGEERAAGRVLHTRRRRQLLELRRVGAGRELDPDEESAGGAADLDVRPGEHLPQRFQHRITLGAVDVDQ